MGAAASKSNGVKLDNTDADYYQLHLSAIFSDIYVESVQDQLPLFINTIAAQPDTAKSTADDIDFAAQQRFKKIMAIMSPTALTSGGGANSWDLGPVGGGSAFKESNRKRMRFLLRIYQVCLTTFAVEGCFTDALLRTLGVQQPSDTEQGGAGSGRHAQPH
jgi:hypothetical protein